MRYPVIRQFGNVVLDATKLCAIRVHQEPGEGWMADFVMVGNATITVDTGCPADTSYDDVLGVMTSRVGWYGTT